MTTLTITPNWKNKTARFKGTIAAGEHVAVRIVNDNGEGDEYIQAEDLANLRLRVVNPMNGKTLAQFPMPEPEEEILPTVALEDEEEDAGEETSEESGAESPSAAEAEAWGGLTPLSCTLNLNTDRMLMAVPPGANVPLLFVLDAYEGATDEDEGEFTLYFKDFCEVTHWPRRRGEDEPTNLDDYKDIIADFREDIYGEGGFKERVENAEANAASAANAAQSAAQSASAANTGAWAAANEAQTSAATAKNWATGGGETGDPGAENNAKHFAQQAGASATSAATSATGAATAAANAEAWAVGKRNGVDVPSTDATYENNAKHYAAAAAASAQEAEETLENKADKSDLEDLSDVVSSLSSDVSSLSSNKADKSATYTKAEVDEIVAAVKTGSRQIVQSLPASGQPLVIYMVAKSSAQTNNAYDEYIWTAAGAWEKIGDTEIDLSGYVQKEAGKGLSTNDYTTTEKTKLAGVEAGAKDNVVEAASASAFPQTGVTGKIYVAKDENKTYRWDGSQYVQIGGGGSSVDVVPPSTDPADAGKAADAKATGDALAGKLSKAEAEVGFTEWGVSGLAEGETIVTPPFWVSADGIWYLETSVNIYGSDGTADSDSLTFRDLTHTITATRTRLPTMADLATKQDAISDLAAIRSGAAAGATAVQPSALAEAVRYDLPASVTNIADATQEEVEGGTIYYAEATLADRKANWLIVTTLLDELRLTFPVAVSGKVRDFGLRLEIGSQLTAPALVLPNGVTVGNPDGAIPEVADGGANDNGVTLLYFSENAPDRFLVKGEEVKEEVS